MMLLDTKVNNACKGIEVQENSTKVEEFFVGGLPKITQLSDHYAVETTLLVNPENVPVPFTNKSKL